MLWLIAAYVYSRTVATLAYRRRWTQIRNYRTERRRRQLISQHDLSGTPVVLVGQFAQLSVRSEQLDREIFLIDRQVKHITDMDAETFARWSFLVTEHRRCALAIAQLAKSVFGEQYKEPALDLVGMMANGNDAAETVEPYNAKVAEAETDPSPVSCDTASSRADGAVMAQAVDHKSD
jgi:hypothetical protein